MEGKSFGERVKAELSALPSRLREARAVAPEVFGHKNRVFGWLRGARRAQILAVAFLVIGLFVMPPARRAIVDTFYPSVRSGGFFGVGARRRPNPRGDWMRYTINFLYWTTALGTTGVALALRLPAAAKLPGDEEDAGAEVGSAPTMLAAPTEAPASGVADTMLASAGTAAATEAGAGAGAGAGAAAATPGSLSQGRYRIDGELGRGGMGVVFRAHDVELDRTVALKEVAQGAGSNPEVVERFRQEARVLARLSHPNIVPLYDMVRDGDRTFMAMELVSGGSLREVLEREGALPLERALDLGRQIAEGLAYAHGEGVVHRDLKPDNILLADDGRPKLTDFGLAKMARTSPNLTQPGSVMGSPAYMSPEQAAGKDAGVPSDLYSFGVILYELCTGQPPFGGDTGQMLIQHITQAPPAPRTVTAEVPEPVERLILALLEKDPAARPADAETVVRALGDVVVTRG